MTAVQTANRIPLDDYAGVVGLGEIEELRILARPLLGRHVEMVNSTAVGGGVAEILNRIIPLAEDLGLSFRWDVITGGQDFFAVTKAFHNALHGAPYHPRPRDFEIFREYQHRNLHRLPLDAEFVVIHDPQPLGLIDDRRQKSLGLAMPHRSFPSQLLRLGFPIFLCGALRRLHLFLA